MGLPPDRIASSSGSPGGQAWKPSRSTSSPPRFAACRAQRYNPGTRTRKPPGRGHIKTARPECPTSRSACQRSAESRQEGLSSSRSAPRGSSRVSCPWKSAEYRGEPLHRVPDRDRSQEIARYVAGNPDTYVLPTITCLVDEEVHFDEGSKTAHARDSERYASARLTNPHPRWPESASGGRNRSEAAPGTGDERSPCCFT